MIPSRFEYLFLLLVFTLIIGSLVWDHLRALLRRPAYYKSLVLCMAVFTVIDRLAVRWNWWVWSADRTLGVRLLQIPIEEFVLFVLAHALCLAAWEMLRNDVA